MSSICTICGSTDSHLTIGWPVCLNDSFHEEWPMKPLVVWQVMAGITCMALAVLAVSILILAVIDG